MVLSVDPVAQYAKDMHAVCGWVVSGPDVYEADLSQRCLFLVIRNTWTWFQGVEKPARKLEKLL